MTGPGSVVFGRYLLIEQIGAGGAGVVWKATDQTLDQTVALKRVPFAGLADEAAQLARNRALREARLAAQLRGHAHVTTVYDVLADHGDIWLVMEYVPAHSLRELLLSHGPLDPDRVGRIGAQVADALAAAHARGIEHRDVKPGNVLVTDDGAVKLTDFGISHLSGDPKLTSSGITGTPAYMAPEVADRGEASPAADMFSLGSTLYAAVEGQPPFGADDNVYRLLNQVRGGIIRPPTRAGPLEPLLIRLLQPLPAARPDAATTRDLLTQLAGTAGPPPQAERPEPPRPRWGQRLRSLPRRRTAAAALGTIAVLAAAALGLSTVTDDPDGAPPVSGTSAQTDQVLADKRNANPCALLDDAALRQFGQVKPKVSPLLESCAVTIIADSGESDARIIFDTPRPASDLGELVGQVGDVSIFGGERSKIDASTPVCQYSLLSPGKPMVEIRADVYEDPVTTDVCAIAKVTADRAASRLAGKSIPKTTGRTNRYALGRSDACAALDNSALRKVPNLNPDNRKPGYARWSCSWGDEEASVALAFYLYQSPSNLGERKTVAGKDVYLDSSEKHCRALAVYRPARNSEDATDMFTIDVDSSLPPAQICNLATELVATAQKRLP